MKNNSTLILTHSQIEKKLERMAWEIFENNYNEKCIILIGIEDKGVIISKAISDFLKNISSAEIVLGTIEINKSDVFDSQAKLICNKNLENQVVILIDDVINSGKTILACMIPIAQYKPRKIQTAVLAKRNHRMFPVKCNIFGISLATTLQEHIWFEIDNDNKMKVYLT
ncbi:MAG: phosphoribosyltransferase [Bacteroidetes bacterium]|nr:phosphoribosyltransferase [Bacteroidota bacterium]